MNRRITPEESEKLFLFCRQHYVYHYDLQVELVDHLASAIEDQWENNPKINFNTALQNSFGKFGITGFSKIKEQKRKELARKYNRLLWNYLFDFFKWPKIVTTFAFTLILTSILKIATNDIWVLAAYFMGLTVFIFYYYYKIFPKRFKIDKVNGKNFLLLESLRNVQLMAMIFAQAPIHFVNIVNISTLSSLQNTFAIFGVSLLIVLFTIALFGELFYVPEKVKQHFKEQFPEFAL